MADKDNWISDNSSIDKFNENKLAKIPILLQAGRERLRNQLHTLQIVWIKGKTVLEVMNGKAKK